MHALSSAPDFQSFFESAPGMFLVLAPDFTIIAASDDFVKSTMTQRENIIGRSIFDVFPDNPGTGGSKSASNLRASLERVRETRMPQTMDVLKYDIRKPLSVGGEFEERYWKPVNSPILNDKGELLYIINHSEDVTQLMQLRQQADEIMESGSLKRRPSDTFLVKHSIIIGIFAVTILTLVLGLMFYRQVSTHHEARDWVVHTYQVRDHLQMLFGKVKDAQLGQRGYLLTSDEAYLSPYLEAIDESQDSEGGKSIGSQIRTLKELMKDNPTQLKNVVVLEDSLNHFLAYLARTIELHQTGKRAANLQEVDPSRGRQLMMDIRAVVKAMQEHEETLLYTRTEMDVASEKQSILLISGSIIVFYIGMSLAMWLLMRHGKRARALETEVLRRAREVADANNKLQGANAELDNSRMFLNNIINNVADPIFVKDRQHRWITGNNAFWTLMGKPEREIVGRSDYEFFSKEEADIFWQKDEEVFQSGISNNNIENLTDSSGNTHILSTKKARFQKPDGEMILVGVIRDITEITRIQERLRENDQTRLKSIMDHSGRAVYIKDLDGKYLQVNKDFLNLVQREEKDVIGKSDYDFFSRDVADNARQNDLEVVVQASSIEFEESLPRNNEIRIFTCVKFPLYDATDRLYAICSIASDVTDRKRMEKENALLAAIVSSSDDAIISKSLDGTVLSWNTGAEQLFGYSADEMIGKHIEVLIPEGRLEEEEAIINNISSGNTVDHSETIRQHKDGHMIDVSLTVSPIKDVSGKVIGASKIARDISTRKRVESQLLRYTQELERSNKELDDFAYIASHDLKEPLRGIHNHARFLLEDNQDKLQQESVNRLGRLVFLSQRMEKLVNDLLYFSRLGRQELAIQQTDMNAVVHDIEVTMEVFVTENNAQIILPKILPTVTCDKPRVTEALRNLITNAIKYNNKEIKTIEIGFLSMQPTRNGKIMHNVFYVRDNGEGIAPEFYDEVFRIFKRLHTRKNPQEDGTGAGLTFVKKIIERHGGKIWLDSEIGKGTTFYFTLEKERHDIQQAAA